jgi:Protein of unknown function (DUF3108)
MPASFLRFTVSVLLAWSTLTGQAATLDPHPLQYKFNLPPSADLIYAIKARQSGLSLDGASSIKWHTTGKKFTIITETQAAIIGKILDAKSEGNISAYGLAPIVFTEKRFRKEPTITSFNYDKKVISFNGSEEIYPIQGGEQDRNSAIWQLVAVIRGTPNRFQPGSEWKFFVAGQRDAETWMFKVIQHEKIMTPLGEIQALHIIKTPPPNAKSQQVDIWLAPLLEWYPVRLRFTDADNDFIEQTLEVINKKHEK